MICFRLVNSLQDMKVELIGKKGRLTNSSTYVHLSFDGDFVTNMYEFLIMILKLNSYRTCNSKQVHITMKVLIGTDL